MRIAGTASAAPPHFYSQSVLLEAFKAYWAPRLENLRMLERLWANAGVEGRHLVQPMEAYLPMDTWGKANNVWMRAAVDLGSTAICRALANAGLDARSLARCSSSRSRAFPALRSTRCSSTKWDCR